MANRCPGQIQACAMRISKLDGSGVPNPGAQNMYVTNSLITLGYTAEVAVGDDVEVRNACGEVCLSYKDCDRLKRLNVEITLCKPDPELMEVLVGGTRLVSGDAVGYAFPQLNATSCPQGVSIELWARAVNSAGSPDDLFPYNWWVFPRVYLQHNAATFENGPFQPQFSGFAIENENWFDGPLNDWPVASTRVAQMIPTDDIPTPSCGYAAIAAS